MKFNKELLASALPEWRLYFLDYKALKKVIKLVGGDDVVPPAGSGQTMLDQPTPETAQFWVTLEKELVKIHRFYQLKSAWAARQLSAVESAVSGLELDSDRNARAKKSDAKHDESMIQRNIHAPASVTNANDVDGTEQEVLQSCLGNPAEKSDAGSAPKRPSFGRQLESVSPALSPPLGRLRPPVWRSAGSGNRLPTLASPESSASQGIASPYDSSASGQVLCGGSPPRRFMSPSPSEAATAGSARAGAGVGGAAVEVGDLDGGSSYPSASVSRVASPSMRPTPPRGYALQHLDGPDYLRLGGGQQASLAEHDDLHVHDDDGGSVEQHENVDDDDEDDDGLGDHLSLGSLDQEGSVLHRGNSGRFVHYEDDEGGDHGPGAMRSASAAAGAYGSFRSRSSASHYNHRDPHRRSFSRRSAAGSPMDPGLLDPLLDDDGASSTVTGITAMMSSSRSGIGTVPGSAAAPPTSAHLRDRYRTFFKSDDGSASPTADGSASPSAAAAAGRHRYLPGGGQPLLSPSSAADLRVLAAACDDQGGVDGDGRVDLTTPRPQPVSVARDRRMSAPDTVGSPSHKSTAQAAAGVADQASSSSSSAGQAAFVRVRKQASDLLSELSLLAEYLRLNDTAVYKIVKKFDKYTGSTVLHAYLDRIHSPSSPHSFLLGQHVAGLRARADALATRLHALKPAHHAWSRTKVYTIGTFDLVHHGHINLLKGMAAFGRTIIVGIHDDVSYEQLKGSPPVDTLLLRMANIEPYCDQIFVIPATDPTPFIQAAVAPSDLAAHRCVYVRGDDMPDFPSRQWVEANMPVHLLPRTDAVSSSFIKAVYYSSPGQQQQQQPSSRATATPNAKDRNDVAIGAIPESGSPSIARPQSGILATPGPQRGDAGSATGFQRHHSYTHTPAPVQYLSGEEKERALAVAFADMDATGKPIVTPEK